MGKIVILDLEGESFGTSAERELKRRLEPERHGLLLLESAGSSLLFLSRCESQPIIHYGGRAQQCQTGGVGKVWEHNRRTRVREVS